MNIISECGDKKTKLFIYKGKVSMSFALSTPYLWLNVKLGWCLFDDGVGFFYGNFLINEKVYWVQQNNNALLRKA